MMRVKEGDRAELLGHPTLRVILLVVGRSPEGVEKRLGGGRRWFTICLNSPFDNYPPLMQGHILETMLRPLPPIREEDIAREKFRISLLRIKRRRQHLQLPSPGDRPPRPAMRRLSKDDPSR